MANEDWLSFIGYTPECSRCRTRRALPSSTFVSPCPLADIRSSSWVELELNRRVREQSQELIERYLREQPELRERFELFGGGLGGLLGLS